MSPQLAAGITGVIGLCMVAGWMSAFRNRAYLGLLGLSFLALSGFFLSAGRVRAAQELSIDAPGMLLLARTLLVACLVFFLLAAAAAARETARRLREIRTSHREAEEAMLEMFKAAAEKERDADSRATDADAGSEGESE